MGSACTNICAEKEIHCLNPNEFNSEIKTRPQNIGEAKTNDSQNLEESEIKKHEKFEEFNKFENCNENNEQSNLNNFSFSEEFVEQNDEIHHNRKLFIKKAQDNFSQNPNEIKNSNDSTNIISNNEPEPEEEEFSPLFSEKKRKKKINFETRENSKNTSNSLTVNEIKRNVVVKSK